MLCSDTENGSAKMACSSSMASGTAKSMRGVRGHQLGVAAGRVARHAGVDAGADLTGREAPAEAEVARLARGAQGRDAARRARQPGVEDHPLPDVEALGLRSQLGDLGHHLVPHDLRERAEAAHGVVAVAVTEVEEDLLRVGAADAGEPRAGDEPVRSQRPRVRDVQERHRGDGEVLQQRRGVGRRRVGLRRGPEHERLSSRPCRSSASSLVKLRFDPNRNSGGSTWRATTAPRNDAGTYCSCLSPCTALITASATCSAGTAFGRVRS